jgi:hypothetical protein
MTDTTYVGPVGFGSDGVHYPLDQDGRLDLERPLRWVEGTTYRDAAPDEALHNDTHHVAHLELDPGGES